MNLINLMCRKLIHIPLHLVPALLINQVYTWQQYYMITSHWDSLFVMMKDWHIFKLTWTTSAWVTASTPWRTVWGTRYAAVVRAWAPISSIRPSELSMDIRYSAFTWLLQQVVKHHHEHVVAYLQHNISIRTDNNHSFQHGKFSCMADPRWQKEPNFLKATEMELVKLHVWTNTVTLLCRLTLLWWCQPPIHFPQPLLSLEQWQHWSPTQTRTAETRTVKCRFRCHAHFWWLFICLWKSEPGNHLSCSVSLCDGIDTKQAGVRIRGIEGCGLRESQRSSSIRILGYTYKR